MRRPGQPCELAPVYVLMASDEASYISGATVALRQAHPSPADKASAYVDRTLLRLIMPRYFFPCRSGCESIPDDAGVDLSDNDAARFSALQIINSMLKDERSDWRGWVMV